MSPGGPSPGPNGPPLGPETATRRENFFLQKFISCVSVFISLERAHSSWGRIALYVHDLPETVFTRGEKMTHGSKMAKTKSGEI